MYVYFYKAVNLHSALVKVLFLFKTSCRFHVFFSLFMAPISLSFVPVEPSSACAPSVGTEDSPTVYVI